MAQTWGWRPDGSLHPRLQYAQDLPIRSIVAECAIVLASTKLSERGILLR